MKEQQIKRWKGALVGILLSGITTLSVSAQSADGPKGMYKLKEIVQQDGKHVEAEFLQYKYCLDNYTFTLERSFPRTGVHSFNLGISNPDGKPLTYTGELSKTENKGIQTFATSDSTFTERWFNDRSDFNPRLFPFQTNIDELYDRVDSSDVVNQAMKLLQMRLGVKTHPLHGVWKLRGMPTKAPFQRLICCSFMFLVFRLKIIYVLKGSKRGVKVTFETAFNPILQEPFCPYIVSPSPSPLWGRAGERVFLLIIQQLPHIRPQLGNLLLKAVHIGRNGASHIGRKEEMVL